MRTTLNQPIRESNLLRSFLVACISTSLPNATGRLLITCVVSLAIGITATLLATNRASATLVGVDANWSYTITGQGYTSEVFTGTTEFNYDDASITGVGIELLDNLPLSSFSQSPMIGVTTFTTGNTLGRVRFDTGVVTDIATYGVLDGNISTSSAFDDFYMQVGTFFQHATVSVATFSGTATDFSPTGSFTLSPIPPIPEPSTLTLLYLGLLALIRRRRSRTSTP